MIVDVDITYEQLCKIALEFTIDCETGEITIIDYTPLLLTPEEVG